MILQHCLTPINQVGLYHNLPSVFPTTMAFPKDQTFLICNSTVLHVQDQTQIGQKLEGLLLNQQFVRSIEVRNLGQKSSDIIG